MKLIALNLHLNTYGANQGRYTGEITYENKYGETKLVLDSEISDKVLAFIGPVITAAAGCITAELQKAINEGLLESKAHAQLSAGPIEIEADTEKEES